MLKRTLTSLGLIAFFLGAFMLGAQAIEYVVYGLIAIASYEMYRVTKNRWPGLYIIVFAIVYSFFGIRTEAVVAIVSMSLLIFLAYALLTPDMSFEDLSFVVIVTLILSLGVNGIATVLKLDLAILGYIIVATYATDTFAYLGGSMFGKHKLIERISPKKTVEGAIAGTLGSIVLSLIFAHFFVNLESNIILYASLFIPIAAQIGDLTFSMIKRKFGIKDFGNLFPGHGGVLDRIDSVLFSLIVFNIIITVL